MKILITGTNGYIGSSMFEYFKKKYDVTIITRNVLDLLDTESVNNFFSNKYFDVILHCAAVGVNDVYKDDVEILDKNLIMYYNILANRKSFNKFINFGSGAELYFPKKPYGFSKLAIHKSIQQKDNFYNLRLFAVFDENETEKRLIKSNIIRYINNQNLYLYNNKKMDFFFMRDLISVTEYFMVSQDLPKEYDCVYKEKINVSDILEKINNLENKKVGILIEGINDFQYIGTYQSLNIKYVGLDDGIKHVHEILKNRNLN